MQRYIILTLLLLALAALSARDCATGPECRSSCPLQQVEPFRHQARSELDAFDQNLPAYRQQVYFAIGDIDAARAELARCFSSGLMADPSAEGIKNLVSLRQLEAFRDLPPIEYSDKWEAIRFRIRDIERFRGQFCPTGELCRQGW